MSPLPSRAPRGFSTMPPLTARHSNSPRVSSLITLIVPHDRTGSGFASATSTPFSYQCGTASAVPGTNINVMLASSVARLNSSFLGIRRPPFGRRRDDLGAARSNRPATSPPVGRLGFWLPRLDRVARGASIASRFEGRRRPKSDAQSAVHLDPLASLRTPTTATPDAYHAAAHRLQESLSRRARRL